MSYIEDLKDVIRKLHGADSTHLKSVPVIETFNGQTVWDGTVEVFKLHGHPTADTAYAWSHSTSDRAKPTRHIAVLHLGPVISAETAVRAAILQEFRANAEA